MPGTIPAARQHLIDDIAKLARKTRGAPLPLPAFVQAYYRGVAPLALEFERALLDTLSKDDRAALDRLLGVLTQRAEVLSVDLRVPKQSARAPRARRLRARRDPAR